MVLTRFTPALAVCGALAVLFAPQSLGQGGVGVRLSPGSIKFQGSDPQSPEFLALGVPEARLNELAKLPAGDPGWARVFAVYVRDPTAAKEDRAGLPPIAGSYSLDKEKIRFAPRFPLRPGLTYEAVLIGAPGHGTKTLAVTIEKPAAEPARVTQIYPTGDVLPENVLRFYLYFSAPMSRGEAYKHLRFLDDGNKAAELAILELAEELWDTSGKRLTILIDPGRIKQGLKPREDSGTVFNAGSRYTLVVSKEWRDARGEPLGEGFQKKFRVAPPVGKAIEPSEWKIAPAAAGTRDPLVIRFPRPLDHALLERTLSVVPKQGGPALAGKVTVAAGEDRWEFRPEEPWPAAPHELVVDPTLEDLAGNRIGRAFEVLGGAQPTGGAVGPVRLPLTGR
jgi:hypothetical protein